MPNKILQYGFDEDIFINEKGDNSGTCLYVLQFANDVKIGITNCFYQRFYNYECDGEKIFKACHSFYMDRDKAKEIERELIDEFGFYNTRHREYFAIPFHRACNFLRSRIEEVFELDGKHSEKDTSALELIKKRDTKLKDYPATGAEEAVLHCVHWVVNMTNSLKEYKALLMIHEARINNSDSGDLPDEVYQLLDDLDEIDEFLKEVEVYLNTDLINIIAFAGRKELEPNGYTVNAGYSLFKNEDLAKKFLEERGYTVTKLNNGEVMK